MPQCYMDNFSSLRVSLIPAAVYEAICYLIHVLILLGNISFIASTFYPTQALSHPMLLSYWLFYFWSFEMRLTTQVLSFLSSDLVIVVRLWLGTEGKVGLLVSLWTTQEIMHSWVLSVRRKKTPTRVWLYPNNASYSPHHHGWTRCIK